MNKKLDEAIKQVFEELNSMSKQELEAEIEKHKDGDFAKILLESGAAHLFPNYTSYTEIDENTIRLNTDEPCQDCGERKPDVTCTTCPYAAEIHDIVRYITVCNDCRRERAMEI